MITTDHVPFAFIIPISAVDAWCNDSNACKVKLADSSDDAVFHTCYGTVLVGCGNELEFYYGPHGQFEYSVSNGRRSLMMEADVAKSDVLNILRSPSRSSGAEVASTSLREEGVEGVTSSSLRGSAK
jgi:hypothetical protein